MYIIYIIISGKSRRGRRKRWWRRHRVCHDWDLAASDKPYRHVPHIAEIERKLVPDTRRTQADLAIPRTSARFVDWTILKEKNGWIKILDSTRPDAVDDRVDVPKIITRTACDILLYSTGKKNCIVLTMRVMTKS